MLTAATLGKTIRPYGVRRPVDRPNLADCSARPSSPAIFLFSNPRRRSASTRTSRGVSQSARRSRTAASRPIRRWCWQGSSSTIRRSSSRIDTLPTGCSDSPGSCGH